MGKKNLKLFVQNVGGGVETTTFQNPDAQIHKNPKNPKKAPKNAQEDVMDMKTTRHEIMKFAVASLKNAEKLDAEQKLALELGARPERKVCVNYKTFMSSQKAKRESEKLAKIGNCKPRLKNTFKISKKKVSKGAPRKSGGGGGGGGRRRI